MKSLRKPAKNITDTKSVGGVKKEKKMKGD